MEVFIRPFVILAAILGAIAFVALIAFAISLAGWLRNNDVSIRGFRVVYRKREKQAREVGFEVKPITGQPPVLAERDNDHG